MTKVLWVLFIIKIPFNNCDSDLELSVSFVVAPSQQPSNLIVRYETNIQKVASDLVASSPAPTEGFNPSNLSTAKGVAEGIGQAVSESNFLESIRPFKEMFDRLAQVWLLSHVFPIDSRSLPSRFIQWPKLHGVF